MIQHEYNAVGRDLHNIVIKTKIAGGRSLNSSAVIRNCIPGFGYQITDVFLMLKSSLVKRIFPLSR